MYSTDKCGTLGGLIEKLPLIEKCGSLILGISMDGSLKFSRSKIPLMLSIPELTFSFAL